MKRKLYARWNIYIGEPHVAQNLPAPTAATPQLVQKFTRETGALEINTVLPSLYILIVPKPMHLELVDSDDCIRPNVQGSVVCMYHH